MFLKGSMIILIISSYCGIIQGKAINNGMNIELKTLIENQISNSTSTAAPQPNKIIEFLPTWARIVLGITLTLVLCCLCCCPNTLCQILCCPLCCAVQIILLPVDCCLCCLGFDRVGPRASSLAARFQSMCYGGNTPPGSCFSVFQSYSMRQNYDYL